MTDPPPIVLGPWVRAEGDDGLAPRWRRYVAGTQLPAITCFMDAAWTIWDDLGDHDGYGDRASADKAFLALYPDATLESS